jgi:hypothetical protein
LEEALERFQTETTASMKCAAKVIDPINEERLEEAKKAERAEVEASVETEKENEQPEDEPEAIAEESQEAPAEEVPAETENPKKGKGKKSKK